MFVGIVVCFLCRFLFREFFLCVVVVVVVVVIFLPNMLCYNKLRMSYLRPIPPPFF